MRNTRVYLVPSGLLVLALTCTFFEIADGVFEVGLANSLDLSIANAVHQAASPSQLQLGRAVSELGGPGAQVGLGLLVGWRLLALRRRDFLAAWSAGLLGGSLLNFLLKGLYQRQRPVFESHGFASTSYSFPSGHAMNSVVLYGLLAYLILMLAPRVNRYLVTGAALLLATAIGLSRIVLGVHYLTDVVAGWLGGAIWAAFIILCCEALRTPKITAA